MAKKKITDEERERLRQIEEANKALMASILMETEALTPADVKMRDLKKEQEVFELLNGDKTSIYTQRLFNTILMPTAQARDITYKPPYYDRLFAMTGLKKSEKDPHYKPGIFAYYTEKYIYDRFNIRNLMEELRERNPFITGSSMREFKHYRFFNDPNYRKLQGFISDFIAFSEGYDLKMYQFDIDYCKKYNLTTDGDLFLNF